jgi:hypothetical protein
MTRYLLLLLALALFGCLATPPDVAGGRLGNDDDSAGDDDDSSGHEHGDHAAEDHVHEPSGFDWSLDCEAWESGPILLTAGAYSLEYEIVCHHGTRLDEAEQDIDANADDIDANRQDIDGHTHPVVLPAPTGSIVTDPVVWAGDCEIDDIGGLASPLPPILYSYPASGDLFFGGSVARTVTATASGLGCPAVSCTDTWGDGGTLEDGDLWRVYFPACITVGGDVALHRPSAWAALSPQSGYAWEAASFVGAAPATVTTGAAQ